MASVDDINVTVAAELQNWTLTDVTPVDDELGRGAYGKVFTVRYRENTYAAKEIHSLLLEVASPDEKKKIKNTFLRECYHCSLLSHPNIVRFIGVYYSEKNSFIPVMMMELLAESLTHYVKKHSISMEMKAFILYDVAFGLDYLHSYNPPIVHRDLSPNNVLMSRDSIAKISDLGVAKVVRADSRVTQTMLTKAPGTVDFMPPELFEEMPNYNTSLDIFSYAGIVLHVVNQEWPSPVNKTSTDPKTGEVRGLSEVERCQIYLNKMEGKAKVLKFLVTTCLHNLPSKRPAITAVLKLLEPLMVSMSHIRSYS